MSYGNFTVNVTRRREGRVEEGKEGRKEGRKGGDHRNTVAYFRVQGTD